MRNFLKEILIEKLICFNKLKPATIGECIISLHVSYHDTLRRIKFVFFDPIEADNMIAMLEMPLGTPVEQTREIAGKIEQAAFEAVREFDAERPDEPSLLKHVATTVGSHPTLAHSGPVQVDLGAGGQSHLAEVNVELLGAEDRDISSSAIKNRWRELVGEIAGISSLTFVSEWASTGDPINVELSHRKFDTLLEVSSRLKEILRNYTGVSDIADDFNLGKAELKLELKETGRMLGLTLSDLARQVRQGFYGEEAQRIQRGRDDIRVMIRYPEDERKSLADVENMRIRLPDGSEIPFNTVAEVQYGRGYSTIMRIDRRRVVTVSADVDETVANANDINKELLASVLPSLSREFAGLQRISSSLCWRSMPCWPCSSEAIRSLQLLCQPFHSGLWEQQSGTY